MTYWALMAYRVFVLELSYDGTKTFDVSNEIIFITLMLNNY